LVLGGEELAGAIALVEREQVVVPFAVCMRSKIWVFADFANNADIDFATAELIDCIEGFLIGINPADCFVARHAPLVGEISDVGDVLMTAHPIGLCNACDLKFWHELLLLSLVTEVSYAQF